MAGPSEPQSDLDRRLKQLQEVLDERVTLLSTKPPAKLRGRRGRSNGAKNQERQNDEKKEQSGFFTFNPPPNPNAHDPRKLHGGSKGSSSKGSEATNKSDLMPPQSNSADALLKNFDSYKLGDPLSKPIVTLCPWEAVVSYPSHFIGKTNRPRARVYFDSIYEGRDWDFFYLHNPGKPTDEPVLFVPTAQFDAFLGYINRCLHTALCIPRGQEGKFTMTCHGAGMPKARYLARSSDQRTFNASSLFPVIADADLEEYESTAPPRQAEIQMFFDRNLAARRPKQVSKVKRREKEDKGMMLDVQRMLGVKTSMAEVDAVFICVDVEALERKPCPVSEVGIAVLDTRESKGVPPGPAGRDWWPLMKAFHFRIKEYSGLRNHMFVQGCPGNFNFGESTFPPKADIVEAIMSALQPWYPGKRDLVLVGHSVQSDIDYLADIGIKTSDMHFIREMDTQVLHKVWRHMPDGRSLDAVLSELCIPHNYLHNAGNDAVYTLQAMVGVAIEQAREEELLARGEKYMPALFTA